MSLINILIFFLPYLLVLRSQAIFRNSKNPRLYLKSFKRLHEDTEKPKYNLLSVDLLNRVPVKFTIPYNLCTFSMFMPQRPKRSDKLL
jgi:hypothetical protein